MFNKISFFFRHYLYVEGKLMTILALHFFSNRDLRFPFFKKEYEIVEKR